MKTSWKKQNSSADVQPSSHRFRGFILHILLPLVTLGCGVFIAISLLKTSPQAIPKKRPAIATLVEVEQVYSGPQTTSISALGEIIPAREIELKPRVNGEVTRIDPEFVPGGYFLTGQTILQIDQADYQLVIRQLQSDLAKTESNIVMEMGNQRIAKKELELLGESVSAEEKALILRQPQLENLKAERDSARSKLAKARLDLSRTEIAAPFNAVVSSRLVDIGTKVTESTILARIVGTDAFWLRLTLPVEQLRWVKIPTSTGEKGSLVKIFTQNSSSANMFRTGHVIRLAAALEEQGRMAQLLVKIDDPLSRRQESGDKPKILLGSYVRAEISGVPIASGILLDRAQVHEGDVVWLMDDNGHLDIRPVTITFRNRNNVIIEGGIKDGERVITSALQSPIAGIPLRLQQADAEQGAGVSNTAENSNVRGSDIVN